jgi:hypothetical protein
MFSLKAPAALAEGARQVLADLRAAAALPADLREAKLDVCDARLQQLRDSVVDGHGLRLDGTILHPASGEQVWFDVSAVHTTCKTHLKNEVKSTRERRVAGKEGAGRQSGTLMEAYQDKLDRYALLGAMVERQVLSGLRTAAPLVLPVVVSTHGEFCPGTVQLKEWLVERYRARLRLKANATMVRKRMISSPPFAASCVRLCWWPRPRAPQRCWRQQAGPSAREGRWPEALGWAHARQLPGLQDATTVTTTTAITTATVTRLLTAPTVAAMRPRTVKRPASAVARISAVWTRTAAPSARPHFRPL